MQHSRSRSITDLNTDVIFRQYGTRFQRGANLHWRSENYNQSNKQQVSAVNSYRSAQASSLHVITHREVHLWSWQVYVAIIVQTVLV